MKGEFGVKKQAGKRQTGTVIVLFTVISVLSAVLMGKVAINYNLADYLGSGTQTKMALDIIEDEFGMTGNLQVMAKNVSTGTAEEIRDTIEALPHVLHVNFDKFDETYYKDGNALFIVIIDGDDYSENAKQLSADVKAALASYEGMEYGGTTVEKQSLQGAITSEMVYILAISLCLVVTVLLITSESWLEPIVLLAASGVAVLINRGTNFIFGEISYITNSIAAILQLALSIDYSIVLLHTYRRERERVPGDNGEAMRAAVRDVLKPVSASALTTMAGLLALLFTSFRIGFDIGVVLMKGIVISAVTSVTLLPALVLLLDAPMRRMHKKAFVPKGKVFCGMACRAGRVIVPVALAVVILCSVLQTGNSYLFTDTKSGNAAISDTFGRNNSIVAVYRNSENNFENEQTLAGWLNAYRTRDGKAVLSGYTSYTNTARELYDTEKAVQKLEISEHDAELLFTMYNLYREPDSVRMSFAEFIEFADSLVDGTDGDVQDFVDGDTAGILHTLRAAVEITGRDLTAEELYDELSADAMAGSDVTLFAVRQLYGMYLYEHVPVKTVDFKTMLDFIITSSGDGSFGAMADVMTVAKLKFLSAGIAQFTAQMDRPMDRAACGQWASEQYGIELTDEQLARIYGGYFAALGEPQGETIPFLPLAKFMATTGLIDDPAAVSAVNGYDTLYQTINAAYGYEQFLPVVSQVAAALSGTVPQVAVTDEVIQQVYILYFWQTGSMPDERINGGTFAEYAMEADRTNAVVHGQLTDESRDRLADMLRVGEYGSDSTPLNYEGAYETLSALRNKVKSHVSVTAIEKDKIVGVYIKYATNGGQPLVTPMMACDLLDFVRDNMDANALLRKKMDDGRRRKVADAQADLDKATDLFVGDRYSRMLLSVNLPNESEDTTEFVGRLSDEVKHVFGEDAYITGEVVSTYDLESSFSHDNRFITVFTLVSIFVIVMVIFRSLSLPIILVAMIQGAIFIAMSTQLLGNAIFFMSYIVSTCILMGATIDYGILMSSNYVAYRAEYDRKQALARSIEAAMPTVFSSGLILTVCGFVIHLISSQNSISTVGLLLGIGTICSVVMITVVLPAVLFLLDGFVLKLSLRKKTRQSDRD